MKRFQSTCQRNAKLENRCLSLVCAVDNPWRERRRWKEARACKRPAGTMAGAGTRNDRQSQRAQEVACVRAARGSLTDPHQINDRE